MRVTSDAEWRECRQFRELLNCLGHPISPRKARLIAAQMTSDLWHFDVPAPFREAMDRAARSCAENLLDQAIIEAEITNAVVKGLEREVDNLKAQKVEYQGEKDWYGMWEATNAIIFRNRDIAALRLSLEAFSVDDLSAFFMTLPERLTLIFMAGPEWYPEQLRPRRPSEVPWWLMVRLRGSIQDPLSIMDRALLGCLRHRCDVIREQYASPFVQMNLGRLSLDTVYLASEMQQTGRFDGMERLGYMLQDDGCEDTDVLMHCSDPCARHFRGCWLLDRILGMS